MLSFHLLDTKGVSGAMFLDCAQTERDGMQVNQETEQSVL